MFKKDQPICQEMASDDKQLFLDTIMFVSISIRQQTSQLENLMFDYGQRGEFSSGMFGFKYHTLNHSTANLDEMYRYYKEFLLSNRWLSRNPKEQAAWAMLEYLRIPGLNMAKAGLLTQLLLGKSWCADGNSIGWYGINYNRYKVSTRTGFVIRANKVDAYLNLCVKLGGTEKLWNNWCVQISKMYPKHFETPARVSSLHWRVHDQMPF